MTEKEGKSSGEAIEIPIGKYAARIRNNPWIVSTIVLALALILILIFGRSGSSATGYSVSSGDAGENLVGFINAQGTGEAKLISSEREGALYKVTVDYNGQEIPVYTTLDGKYLISNPIPLSEDAGSSGSDAGATSGRERVAEVEVGDSPVKGDANAKVTIVEFSDYQCPFCGRFFQDTLPSIKKEYIETGKAKLVYKDFPLSFHENAQKAAEAARCAGEQSKYWEMHDKLFGNQESLGESNYKKWAREIGLNGEKFDDCLSTGKHAQEVKDDASYGAQLGVSGTPAFYINGRELVGAQPFSAFKKIIDEELAK